MAPLVVPYRIVLFSEYKCESAACKDRMAPLVVPYRIVRTARDKVLKCKGVLQPSDRR
jgi:hypothetical protein